MINYIQHINIILIFAPNKKNITNMKKIIISLIVLTAISSCKMSGFTSVDSVATGVVCDSIKIHHHYSTNKR